MRATRLFLFLFSAIFLSACGGLRGGSGAKFTPISGGVVTSVRVTGNQVQITGTNPRNFCKHRKKFSRNRSLKG
jgi:hypothetical protein